MNFWNIKYSKERLAILEKAQAQKRHLMSLMKVRSVVADSSQSHSRVSTSLNRSLSKSNVKKDNSFSSLEIQRNNNILYKKIVNTEKLQSQRPQTQCKFINMSKELSRNHSMVFRIQKNMKQKSIDEENTKIFARLIQTSPTIKRNEWMRQNIETAKYKENIHRSKYAMPDYSLEACKLLSNQSSKKYNLKPLNKTVANPQLKFRNLKGSSISSNQMRF